MALVWVLLLFPPKFKALRTSAKLSCTHKRKLSWVSLLEAELVLGWAGMRIACLGLSIGHTYSQHRSTFRPAQLF